MKNEEDFSRQGWCGAQIRQRKFPAQDKENVQGGEGEGGGQRKKDHDVERESHRDPETGEKSREAGAEQSQTEGWERARQDEDVWGHPGKSRVEGQCFGMSGKSGKRAEIRKW